MNFLSAAECQVQVGRLGSTAQNLAAGVRPAHFKKAADFFYESRLANAPQVAKELIDGLGNFETCLLWTHGLVWGDRTQEGDPPLDWAQYGLWRESCGAPSALYHSPGQVFVASEKAELARGIEFTIYTGSDALVFPSPTPCFVHLSHDDLISVQSRTNLTRLSAGLEKLGLRRAAMK